MKRCGTIFIAFVQIEMKIPIFASHWTSDNIRVWGKLSGMSLRIRLIASIVIALLVSLCVGGAAAGWHATRSVRTEMLAALAVATQTLRNGLDSLTEARDREDELGRFVR